MNSNALLSVMSVWEAEAGVPNKVEILNNTSELALDI